MALFYRNTRDGTDDYSDYWRKQGVSWKYTLSSEKDFVVYVDHDDHLEWCTTREYDETLERKHGYDCHKNNCILIEGQRLLSAPNEGISNSAMHQLHNLIGRAVVCAFEFDYDSGEKMLGDARDFFRMRSEEVSRFWYLSSSGVAALIVAFLGTIPWIFRAFFDGWLGSDFRWLSLAGSLGAVGALLSVIQRSGKLQFDVSSGWRLHYLEAGSRIVAGTISGTLVALAIKYQVILGNVSRVESLNGLMMLGALVGGTGERLAGSIISTFGSEKNNTEAAAAEPKPSGSAG